MASKTIRSKYPAQIAVMTTDENKERFQAEAERDGVSVAEVIRGYLEAGIEVSERYGDTYAGADFSAVIAPDVDPEKAARDAQYRGLL